MAINYHELNGSPTVTFDRKGGSGQRRFRIEWSEIAAFNAELFPRPSSGYANPASIPGAPWLIALKATYSPFSEGGGEAAPDDDPTGQLNEYSDAGCLVVVDYGVPEDDTQQGSPAGGGGNPDKNGPGGDQGSSAGEDVEWIRHEITIGGEFVTLPNEGLAWRNPNPFAPANAGVAVDGDVHAGLIIATLEHQITLMHVKRPPWKAIRASVGKINSTPYADAPAKRVLFLGGEFRWGRASDGSSEWEMVYKLTEKERDWNEFFRPETGKFEELLRKDGSPIYQTTAFAPLFQNLYA